MKTAELIFVLAFVAIVGFVLIQSSPGFGIVGSGGLSQYFNFANQIQENATTIPESNFNLCSAYTQNYPTYFQVKSVECGMAGGDWICQSDRAGCYDIGAWDAVTGCSSEQAQVLKAFCSVMSGDWTCTAVEISCEV